MFHAIFFEILALRYLKFILILCVINQLNRRIMARPIKETPILTGKDAERFVRRMNEKRIVSENEIKRVKRIMSIFSALKNFNTIWNKYIFQPV